MTGVPSAQTRPTPSGTIDREAVVRRHNVRYAGPCPESPVSVGNGEFAVTVDHTGLQSFADRYERNAARSRGEAATPLGMQAQWGFHWFPNPHGYRLEDTMEAHPSPRGPVKYPSAYDFRESREESEAAGRGAGYYYWTNPQRLHLAQVGLLLDGRVPEWEEIQEAGQELDLWTGVVTSRFLIEEHAVQVRTAVDPERDCLAFEMESAVEVAERLAVRVAFPYVEESFEAPPVWDQPEAHRTDYRADGGAHVWERTVDEARYQVRAMGTFSVNGSGHEWVLRATESVLRCAVEFAPELPADPISAPGEVLVRSARGWEDFWRRGAAVDLGASTADGAHELERRIVLSQYQTRVHCSGSTPPQETGLVCNSWGGTFHLEMHWWHAAHFPAWGRPGLLERSLAWYKSILPVARAGAVAQGFRGARWPKHVGPEGIESPNDIGPLLVWQQPHVISYAELLRTGAEDEAAVRQRYRVLVDETAEFLASFALLDGDAYHLPPPLMPAQEVYGAAQTWDPLFEVAYVRWALLTALAWRRADGRAEPALWARVADGLRPVVSEDGHYDAVQRPPRTVYTDHPAMLGALGVVPDTGAIDHEAMLRTLERACAQWNWRSAWGWDFPMIAMCATRLGRADVALSALLRTEDKNTHLPNGHNRQVPHRMPLYLPGNGGLLMATALLFGGWVDSDGVHRRVELPEGWSVVAEGFPPRP
ncbi:hypothetical protein IM660_18390 [Ruania alkalisoli]|uniref:Glycoside hydrolase family 65 n=1 Tax=Ruania alkalisoli TaxID=2779775 RepID=A0A7M1SSV6_9MICO|nr:hypothetical protein [Ruania alkalisoli]QOR70531.1 hypothetical protein IM660_18390 [Ruania alkalisoli]